MTRTATAPSTLPRWKGEFVEVHADFNVGLLQRPEGCLPDDGGVRVRAGQGHV